jgi:hypothetical protein
MSSLLGNGNLNIHGYARVTNNTRWMHASEEWETSTMGCAVLSIGPARCIMEVSIDVSSVNEYPVKSYSESVRIRT